MTTNVIDAIREKEADAHAEREEAFAERNRLNQAFFDGKLIAYAEVLRLLGEDLEENDGYATCATIARGIPTTKSSCSEEDSVPDERIEKAAIAVFAAQTNWAEPNPTQKTVKALWDGQMDAVRDSFRRLAKAALDSLEDRPADLDWENAEPKELDNRLVEAVTKGGTIVRGTDGRRPRVARPAHHRRRPATVAHSVSGRTLAARKRLEDPELLQEGGG